MFYSQIILAKKGPLGKVWQAAHWGDKKLGRPAIFATDISATVDTITNPAAPMALRVSGHLLLGVVRIYSRQVKYLIDDCQQAMVKVKMAYRLTTGAGGNKGAEAAIIDIEVNPAGARALNISNFGEYSELDFSHANFEIPFDITNETAEEDWVPAELHGQTLDFAPEQPARHSDEDSFGAVASGHKSGARLGADAEEEEWGAFEPDDDEQDENKSKDDSTVSEIEKTRAANNESMVSDPNSSHRLSVLNQTANSADVGALAIPNVGDNGSLSDQEFPPPDDDFMDTAGGGDDVMGMDDDYQPQPPNDSLRLELSNDSNDNLGSSGAPPGISFGEEDDEEIKETKQSNKKKRKSAENQKANNKKQRKIVSEFGATELSSDHIRTMLADTSKVVKSVVHPATWVPGQKKSTCGFVDRQLIRQHATIEKLLQRPCLADDGQLAPKLLDLWARNTAPIRGEPFAYELRQDKNETDKDDEESVEKARLADDNGSTEEVPVADDNDFPEADGGDNPFLDEEDEQNNAIPFDDSIEDQIETMDDNSPGTGSKGAMESVFSLYPTNALDEDFGDDDNEDRQSSEETTAIWHKNTVRVFQVLKNKMLPSDTDSSAPAVDHVSYNELSHGVTRRTAAGVFFELLALKTLNFVELNQTEPFGDIDISPGVKFMEDPPTTKQ